MHSDKLHIGTFITQFPYDGQFDGSTEYFCSGAERVADQLAHRLTDLDCDVTVCTSAASTEGGTEKRGQVTIRRSPSLTTINTTQIAPTQLLDPLVSGYDFDIVHAHNSTPPGVIAGWLAATRNDVPFVITHHGGESFEPHGSLVRRAGLWAYIELMIDPLFRAADVAVSPTEGYVAESSALSSADSTTVIPNGISVDDFDIGLAGGEAKERLGFDPDTFLVLYLGSLHPRKGTDVLLDGFIQFAETCADARLVIGGDGERREPLEARVRSSEVADAVRVPGFIPESKKPLYMNAADVFILPSVTPGSEVFPLVLLEAAAGETPVIASRFETIESVVAPHDMGRLVEPGSPDSIATELRRLYQDDDCRDRLSRNARQMARNHDWNRVAEQYRQLYERLLR